jgi:hypothetical protein
MLNFEIARVIQVDRERDIERGLRERLLRSASFDEGVEAPDRHPSRAPLRAPKLAPSRPR